MAPSVLLTCCATPALPWPACEFDGQLIVSLVPRVQSVGAASVRYFVKLLVVPDASARWTIVMFFFGSVAPGLSEAIAAASQLVILPSKIIAIVGALSWSLSRPLTLNETVIGADTVGKYRTLPPWYFET